MQRRRVAGMRTIIFILYLRSPDLQNFRSQNRGAIHLGGSPRTSSSGKSRIPWYLPFKIALPAVDSIVSWLRRQRGFLNEGYEKLDRSAEERSHVILIISLLFLFYFLKFLPFHPINPIIPIPISFFFFLSLSFFSPFPLKTIRGNGVLLLFPNRSAPIDSARSLVSAEREEYGRLESGWRESFRQIYRGIRGSPQASTPWAFQFPFSPVTAPPTLFIRSWTFNTPATLQAFVVFGSCGACSAPQCAAPASLTKTSISETDDRCSSPEPIGGK